jgi:hypothetical protein
MNSAMTSPSLTGLKIDSKVKARGSKP